MADMDEFGRYVEALNALCMVEDRQRQALRRAVEASTATRQQARAQMADQQRMYDRAGKEVRRAESLLDELRNMLGQPRPPSTTATPQAGMPPPFVEVRASIHDVTSWAEQTKPVVESLLRTRARLANSPKPVVPPPAPVKETSRGKLPIATIVLLVVIAIVVVVLIGT